MLEATSSPRPPPDICESLPAPPTVNPVHPDKATPAAVEYLLTGSLEAWDHLMGICYRFVDGLFVKDDAGDFVVDGPQHDELTGKRNDYFQRREGTVELTRQWISGWLLERLSNYHGRSITQIQEAAEQGEFRYLGRQCRNSLIDRLRKLGIDAPRFLYIDRDSTADGNDGVIGDSIGTWNMGGQSSLCSPSVCREDLLSFVAENEKALAEVKVELMVYIDLYFPDEGDAGEISVGIITNAIAASRDVEERQARVYKRRFLDQARGCNKTLQELFKLLQPSSTDFFNPPSKESQAKQRLRSQALEDLVDFEEWRRDSGLSAGNAVRELGGMERSRENL